MAHRGEQDLEALIAASFEGGRPGTRCWANDLEGPAAQYVAALVQARASGRRPVTMTVWRILRDRFGVHVGRTTVDRHLKGECSCPR